MSSKLDSAGDGSTEWRAIALLGVVCAISIAGGIAAKAVTGSKAPLPAIALGDVTQAHMVEIRDQSGVAVLSGEFRARVDALGNTEKDAPLRDRRGQKVIGEVELEIPGTSREHRRAELEVDIMGLPPRQTFSVVIDDRVVGTFVTDDRGSVDMEIQEGEAPPSILDIVRESQPPR
jgi:hypothetical protein